MRINIQTNPPIYHAWGAVLGVWQYRPPYKLSDTDISLGGLWYRRSGGYDNNLTVYKRSSTDSQTEFYPADLPELDSCGAALDVVLAAGKWNQAGTSYLTGANVNRTTAVAVGTAFTKATLPAGAQAVCDNLNPNRAWSSSTLCIARRASIAVSYNASYRISDYGSPMFQGQGLRWDYVTVSYVTNRVTSVSTISAALSTAVVVSDSNSRLGYRTPARWYGLSDLPPSSWGFVTNVRFADLTDGH